MHSVHTLCEYLLNFLEEHEVALDVFYFRDDPQVCWNEKHPKGISIEALSMRYKERRLAIFYTTRWIG